MTVLVWLVVGLVALSAGLGAAGGRCCGSPWDPGSKRRAHAHAVTRDLVLTVLMGEPDEIQAARDLDRQLTPARRARQAESQIFSYLPKVNRRDAHLFVDLVTERGAVGRARTLLNSWSAVRRCRGAYRLGALHRNDAVPQLVPLLQDRTFLVRRVALRALGAIGDPAAVVPIRRTSGGDDRLTRDVVSPPSSGSARPAPPAMRAELSKGRQRSSGSGRQAELATVGSGLVGDVGSVNLLVDALTTPRPALAGLRRRGPGPDRRPPAPIPALVNALNVPNGLLVRSAAAAGALGDIGDPDAAAGLGLALDRRTPDDQPHAGRVVAPAGDPGTARCAPTPRRTPRSTGGARDARRV